MMRRALVGLVVIALNPAVVGGQTRLTIEAASTDVHESPAVAAPVIGQAQRGRVLDVAREDGDWVTVVWPGTATGVGYVRLRVGSLGRADTHEESSVRDVRADVDAVERAIVAIVEARSPARDRPSR